MDSAPMAHPAATQNPGTAARLPTTAQRGNAVAFFLFMAGVVIVDAAAMSLAEEYVKTNRKYVFVAALLVELVAWLLLVKSLRHGSLGVANVLWDLGSWVLVTVAAMVFFKER